MHSDVRALGATRPLALFYQYSLIRALQDVYPEHEWLPWKFIQSPRSFFGVQENRLAFFTWAAKQLEVRELADWYNITPSQLAPMGGDGLIRSLYGGSMHAAMLDVFPVRSSFNRAPL